MTKRYRLNGWTAAEDARVDKCLAYRVGPRSALQFFPNRTPEALHSRFALRRRALGIPAITGRPRAELRAAVRELAHALAPKKFEYSTALVPPSKPYTGNTPEANASRALLRRHLETGLHWISSPEQYAAACRSVGLGA